MRYAHSWQHRVRGDRRIRLHGFLVPITLAAALGGAACGFRSSAPTAAPAAVVVRSTTATPAPTAAPPVQTLPAGIDVPSAAATTAAHIVAPAGVAIAPVQPTAAATVQPPPSPAESEAVVRAYFAAVDADSREGMRAVTAGQGRADTERIITEMDRQAADAGVTPDMRVTSLSLTMLPSTGAIQPVRADSVIAVYVGVGPFSAAVQEIRSSGTFNVAMTPAGPRIVGISGQIVP